MKNLYKFTSDVHARLDELAVQSIEESQDDLLDEALETLSEARFKIVNRVRKGKVQRRKKVQTQPGFTIRKGKVTRMKAQERMRRKISQRRAAKKRAAKVSRIKRVRTRSLRLRKRTFGK